MLLAGSRCCGGCSCRRVGLRPSSGLGPRPAYPHLLPLSRHEATPQHREALPYLCDWEYGAGGWEKEENACQNACENAYVPESQQDEEKKGKRGKVRMRLTLLCTCTPYYICAVRLPIPVISTPVAAEPLSEPKLGRRRQLGSHTSHQSSWYHS